MRRDPWLAAAAVGLFLLASLAAMRWHAEPRVLVEREVPAAELVAALDVGIGDALRLGAEGLVVELALETGANGPRAVASAQSTELEVVLLAGREGSGDEDAAELLDEALLAGDFEPASVIDAIQSAEDWPGAEGARLVTVPDGPREALRSLAWERDPVLPFGLAFAAAAAAVGATVLWRLRGVYAAIVLGGALAFFAESFDPLALALAATGSAVVALVGVARERAAPPPAPPPPPPEERDLLVIGTGSQLSSRVGLAPPDQTVTTDLAGSWFRVLGVSAAGVRHLWESTPLEDFHAVHADGDRLVVAVADGVSSSADSGSGSRLAAERAVAELASRLPAGDPALAVREAFTVVNDAMLRAVRRKRNGDRMSTTLVVAVAWRGDGERRVVCGRVGDSEALFLSGAGTWERVFGEIGEGEALQDSATAALPSDRPLVEVRERAWPDRHVLMLASDGVADPLIGRQDLVRRTLGDLWRSPPTVEEFRRQVQFSRKGLDDDRTAVAVWAEPEDAP